MRLVHTRGCGGRKLDIARSFVARAVTRLPLRRVVITGAARLTLARFRNYGTERGNRLWRKKKASVNVP